ncbi:MAG: PAS domain S-box protein, partial [Gammaproteobacteria bacterium]
MNKPSPGGIAAKLRSALARLPELWPALFRSATSPNPIDIGQILLTSNGNYMAVVDRDYTYRWVNDGYLNLFNQGRDDIVGHSIAEIFGKEVFETTIRPDMDRCLAGEQVKIDDWRDLPNGRHFFNVILSPYYAEAGHVEWVIVDAHDISDRKRAQQELQDSEERFQLAVRGTNDGLWDWNIKNNQSWWSPRLYELLGYTDGEIEAGHEHFMERVHPDDQGRTHDAIRAHHQQQIPYDIEHRVQTKSGAYRWFRRRGQAVWDNQGKPVRMAGSMCDIHERKAAEAQLDLYRHIVSSTSNFLSYIDRDLIYREVNDAYLQAFGKIRDQIVGCHAQQLFGKEAFEGGIKDYMQQCLGGAAVNYELRLDFPNRGKRLLVVHYDPHRGDDGQVQGIVVSAVDITERRRAEEALRKSDEQLRCFFDAGLVGMAITSPDKEWVQFNQTFCDITGYSREELLQMTWVDITHPDDVVSNVALLDQARAGVIDGYSIEKRFLRKDGKTVYAALSGECVRREDGSLDYIIILFQDITERKQTETAMATLQHQLLQSQKMEAIGQLTGGIAHDFNNILASILGYTDLVLKRCVREGEDKLKEFLMEIKIGGERARDLVTQMLTYSRA